MVKYKLLNSINEDKHPYQNVIKTTENGDVVTEITIPFDERNIYYKEYLKWVAEGNTAEPADE